jgi:hypothetical protein
MTIDEGRLANLRAKSELTDDEFRELIKLSPPGTFRRLPNLQTAGLHDLQQAMKNLSEVGERAKRAFDNGCYVEVLALRSQSAELYLRLYLAAKLNLPPSFPANDRRPLGRLIKASEKVGLNADMIAKLRAFNESRITGVHRYLLGSMHYDELKALCEASKELNKNLTTTITSEIGIPV